MQVIYHLEYSNLSFRVQHIMYSTEKRDRILVYMMMTISFVCFLFSHSYIFYFCVYFKLFLLLWFTCIYVYQKILTS